MSWLRRYMVALLRYPETLSSEQKLEHLLSDLACKRDISASSQNQAFSAIVFFYGDVLGHPLEGVDALRATRPARMRRAPSIDETQALLKAVGNVGGYRICARPTCSERSSKPGVSSASLCCLMN